MNRVADIDVFVPEKSLGIPRSSMPQIKSTLVPDFIDWLKDLEWIVDDSPEWLEYPEPAQLRPSGNLRVGTHIRIEYEENDGQEVQGNDE